MKFYGIDMQGKFLVEEAAGPTWISTDDRRIVRDTDDGRVLIGTSTYFSELISDLDYPSIGGFPTNFRDSLYTYVVERDAETFTGDLNTIIKSGIYHSNPVVLTNQPAGTTGEVNIWDFGYAAYQAQMFVETNSNDWYIRVSENGSWSIWEQIITDDNLMPILHIQDGQGSGLDADELWGWEGYNYMRSLTASAVSANTLIHSGSYATDPSTTDGVSGIDLGQLLTIHGEMDGSPKTQITQIQSGATTVDPEDDEIWWRSGQPTDTGGTAGWGSWKELIHDGNLVAKIQGISGSGLDADLLDGEHGDYYAHVSLTVSGTDPNTAAIPFMITQHANAPSASGYWHIYTSFLGSRASNSNRSQIAVKYSGNPETYSRNSAGTSWSAWRRLDNEGLSSDDGLSPVGGIMAWTKQTAPSGWFLCQGNAVSRTTYSELFSAIGTTFGNGDGSTTFNIPDLRGEFIRGHDAGRGVDFGRGFATSQADELKSHRHSATAGSFIQTSGSTHGDSGNSYGTSTFTEYTGGGETRPRNIALNYIIKY